MLRRLLTGTSSKATLFYRAATAQTPAPQAARPGKDSQAVKPLSAEEELLQRDLRRLAEEATIELRRNSSIYFQDWVNDRKTVFQANVKYYAHLRYKIIGGVFGALFLYMLYRGDAKYKYLITVPIIGALFFRQGFRNSARNSIPYVSEINLHRSGKAADFVIFKDGLVKRFDNVPLSKVSVKKGDFDITVPLDQKLSSVFTPDKNGNYTFNTYHFRRLGYTNDGYLCEIDKEFAVIPLDYTGNQFALDSIFAGKDVQVNNI